jgi:hypothetical protein
VSRHGVQDRHGIQGRHRGAAPTAPMIVVGKFFHGNLLITKGTLIVVIEPSGIASGIGCHYR